MSDYVTREEFETRVGNLEKRTDTIEYHLLKHGYEHGELEEVLRKLAKRDFSYEDSSQRDIMIRAMFTIMNYNVQQIAQKFGLSDSRVYQIINN